MPPDATPPPAISAPATSSSALPSAPPLTATDAVTLPGNVSAPPVNVGGQLGSTPPVTPQAPATPATTTPDWMASLSTEQRGWIQAKGVTDNGQLVEMWKGMEKIVGAGKENLAIIPKEIKGLDDYRNTLTRLGAPAEPTGYGLQPDTANGGTPEASARLAGIFHKASMTKDQAAVAAAEVAVWQKETRDQATAAYETRVTADKQALTVEWGAAADQNTAIAKRAAATFGVEPEVIAAIERSGSYAKVMKFFFNVGARMGEAQYVNGNPGLGLMTPEQASAEKAQLMADQAWRQSYLKGDATKVKKMSELIAAEMGISL